MKTVLVVDDEYLLRWALKEGMQDDYRVLTAASVDEALEILKVESVHAVITDLRMPIRGGLDLVRRLRADRPKIKIFVVSAVGSDEECNQCYDLDVEAVLRKPLEVPVIRRMIDLHLRPPV